MPAACAASTSAHRLRRDRLGGLVQPDALFPGCGAEPAPVDGMVALVPAEAAGLRVGPTPAPTRRRLLRSVFVPSPLVEVVEATQLYVERLSDCWRWSLAHRGSGYPLLRITARFLQVNYHRIMIGFRTLPDGWSILCRDADHPDVPEAWAVIEFEPHTSAADVERRIVAALQRRETSSGQNGHAHRD